VSELPATTGNRRGRAADGVPRGILDSLNTVTGPRREDANRTVPTIRTSHRPTMRQKPSDPETQTMCKPCGFFFFFFFILLECLIIFLKEIHFAPELGGRIATSAVP